MSLSTITTATYDLAKYSRSYNHTLSAQSEGLGELQWQHFTNPVIRLTMETRKGANGHLESYRLKITWIFSAGADSMDVDQREVVFEDLDLVAYSSLPSLQAPQGMPLKAVYQDAVVGIRYQHPRVSPPGTTPQYRCFQIAFESGNSASAFIESIRFICPCKANAPPPPPRGARISATQAGAPVQGGSQVTTMADPSPARSAARPALQQTMSTMSVEEPPSAIRRTHTTLASSAASGAAPTWDSSQALYPAQSPYEYVHEYSRPSSAVAHNSSSSSSGLSSSVSAAAVHSGPAAPVVASTVMPSISARPNASATSIARPPQVPPSATAPIARPPQVQPSTAAPALAHSTDSSDTSLPSSSFPHSSSSPPPPAHAYAAPRHSLRASSPDLMPPPPVPSNIYNLLNTASTMLPAAAAVAAATAPVPLAVSLEAIINTAQPVIPPQDALPQGPVRMVDTTAADKAAVALTATLRTSAELCALPADELERLVAEVVREDGFADLMKALDGMWRVKGLVGAV